MSESINIFQIIKEKNIKINKLTNENSADNIYAKLRTEIINKITDIYWSFHINNFYEKIPLQSTLNFEKAFNTVTYNKFYLFLKLFTIFSMVEILTIYCSILTYLKK